MDYMAYILERLLIGLIIAFLLFLILREFWCWYFKINKRVALLEEQNRLLDSLNKYLIPIVQSSYDVEGIENSIRNKDKKQFIVTKELKILEEPNENSAVVCRILEGKPARFLDKKEIGTATWYKIIDQENTEGWCLLEAQ